MPDTKKPRTAKAAKKHTTQRGADQAIWSVCHVMSRGNVDSAQQYVPELTRAPLRPAGNDPLSSGAFRGRAPGIGPPS
jgi:hypothetical protein